MFFIYFNSALFNCYVNGRVTMKMFRGLNF